MTVAETLLVFAGAPLAITAVLAALTLRPERGRKRLRYKPGQPWEHPPVWYEPHPAESSGGGGGHGPAPSSGPAAVPGSGTAALGSSMYPEQPGERALDHEAGAGVGAGTGGTGGASGGATAGATGRRAHPGGPLGGARGTW